MTPLTPGDVARLHTGGEDHRVVATDARHVSFACEPGVDRPRGTVRRTLGNGARVTCVRCLRAEAPAREAFMETMTAAENDNTTPAARLAALRLIASAVEVLPHTYPRLLLSGDSREAYDALASLPGATMRTTLYRHAAEPHAIEVASMRIGRVEIEAQYGRPLTDAEGAA